MTDDASRGTKCLECGAAVQAGMANCWLCGAQLAEQVPYAEIVPEADAREESAVFFWMAVVLAALFAMVLFGAWRQPIDIVMINTNGLRLAHDRALVESLAAYRDRLEVYLQLDGLDDDVYVALRGEPLVERKLRAVQRLGEHGIRVTPVCTLQPGVNEDQIGDIVRFACDRPWISGVSFQPATYSGRHEAPEALDDRITFPDVIRAVAEQTDGLFEQADFMPLPCAHPNCHSLAYAYRRGREIIPLNRFIDMAANHDLLANGIMFTKPRAAQLVEALLGRLGCCAGGECATSDGGDPLVMLDIPRGGNGRAGGHRVGSDRTGSGGEAIGNDLAAVRDEFFARAVAQQLGAADVFRITITSFLDAYNFDVRRLMKCCIHHVLPSGHLLSVLSLCERADPSRAGVVAGAVGIPVGCGAAAADFHPVVAA